MAKTIKNMGEFSKALLPQLKKTLEVVAEDVKEEIDKAIDAYYEEYDPNTYDDGILAYKRYCYKRTNQLKNCCKIGKPKVVGNVVSVEIYLDVASLHYNAKGADAYKTVVAANAGLHGGWDIGNMEQIPWSMISANTGESYGDGTQIWEEPMRELITNKKLISLFKECAMRHGLNLQ